MLAHLLLPLIFAQIPDKGVRAASKPQEPSHALVIIQERSILLPALPANVDDARLHYKDIQAQLTRENKDVEDILLGLYESPGVDDPLPSSLTLTDEETKDARTLLQIIKDDRAMLQEKAVLEVWDEWVAVLKEAKAGWAPSQTPPPSAAAQVIPGKEKEYEALKKQLSRMEPQFWVNQKDPFTYSNIWEFDDVYDHEGYDRNLAQTAQHTLVAKWVGPQFAAAWRPLVAHLQAHSMELQAIERQPSSSRNPGLDLLKLKTKIQHLERFRSAMWFCGMIWSQMSSSTNPPPLKKLHPVQAR